MTIQVPAPTALDRIRYRPMRLLYTLLMGILIGALASLLWLSPVQDLWEGM